MNPPTPHIPSRKENMHVNSDSTTPLEPTTFQFQHCKLILVSTLKYMHVALAANMRYVAICKVLLGKGAQPDVPDSIHRTPLSYAAEGGHESLVHIFFF